MVAAATMGRAGHLRAAAAARWLRGRARGFSANGNGGGPATPGGGAEIGKATGGGAASNAVGAATGGGAASNGGATCREGGGGCVGVTQLRTEVFAKTRQFWDRYNVGAKKDRELFDKVAELRKDTETTYVSSKVELLSTTYLMVASTGLGMLGLAIGASPYVKERIVRDAADKVEEIIGGSEAGSGAPRDGNN